MYFYNVHQHAVQSIIAHVVVVLLSMVTLGSLPANAQTTAGVGIRPAIINERVEPGEVKQFSIEVSNLSGVDQTFYLSKRDIVGVREGGVPIFADQYSEKTGFELSEWVTLDRTEVFIPADGTENINFLMEVPDTVTPGSHFGGVIISVEPPELSESGASIGYEVANIITVRVAGEANDKANIRQFSTNQYVYAKSDVDFTVRIENEGNTLVTPVGIIEVYNMFGSKVAMLNFNETSAGVYPKTAQSEGLRSYTQNWKGEGVGFGRYESVVTVTYGEEGRKNNLSSTVTFWVLPMNIIGPALAVLIVLFLIIYVGIRSYVRRSVALLAGTQSRRLVRTRATQGFPVLLLVVSMLTVTTLFLIVLLFLFA